MASYAATIDVRVTGLPSLKNLENRIGLLQQNFTKLNAAAANIAAPFAQHIQAINQMNVGLRESTRLLEQQLRLTNVIVSRSTRGGGGGGGGGTNSNVLEEQRRGWQQQILQLQQRARLLTENTAITDKLRSATESLLTGTGQTVRLGLEQLKNAKALLATAEDRAKTEALNFEHQLELIAEVEKEEEQNARNTTRRIKQEQDDRNALLKQRMRAIQQIEKDEERAGRAQDKAFFGGARKGGNRLADALTFGNGSKAVSGAMNAAVRGGVGAAVLAEATSRVTAPDTFGLMRGLGIAAPSGQGVSGLFGGVGKLAASMGLPGAKEIDAVTQAVNSLLSSLANMPGALQLAAVAAFAFAPAIGGIATQAVVKGIPALGKLGKALADVTGLSKTAAPAIEGVKNVFSKGGASFMEPLTNSVSGMNMELNVTNNLVKVLGATLEENLAASKISRLASGFKEFSAGIEGAIGVEKAKRRNLDKRMRGYTPGTDVATQLMLPAFQERGLQQLSTSNINQVAGQTKTTLGQMSAIIKPMTADVSAMALSMGDVKDNTLDVLGVMRQLGLAIEQLQAASSKAEMLAGKSTGTRQGPIEARTKALQDFAILEKKLISEAATLRDTKDLNSYNTRQKRIKYLADLENKASEKRRKVVENVALGAGFPLLFGGGPGAVLGGAAGGLIPGNPMMSVVTSAIGAQLDTFFGSAIDAGKSLREPIANFNKLKEANLFASKEQEFYIAKLIETGRVAQATGEIQSQMIKKVGVSGVTDLAALGAASGELSRTWADFTLQAQAAVAGPMTGILMWLKEIIKLSTATSQMQAQRLDPAAYAKAQEQAAAKASRFGVVGDKKLYEEELNRLSTEIISKNVAKIKAQNIKISPEEREQRIKASEQQADIIKDAYRTGFRLQQQAIDLQRQAADLQRRVADDIFNKQQQIARLQVDAERQRQQIAIETADLEYRRRIGNEEGRVAAVMAAEADLIKLKAQNEADIATKKLTLELDIAKQKRDTENYIYQLNRDIDNLRRATLNYEMEVSDYRLKNERLIAEQRRIEEAGGKNYSNVGGFQNNRQMLHGIPGYAGYDAAHATPENIHYHFSGKSPQETIAVAQYLKDTFGYKITEFSGMGQRVGGHARGSQHYKGNAFDIGGASLGRSDKDIQTAMKLLHARINAFLAGTGAQIATAGSQVKRPNAPLAGQTRAAGEIQALDAKEAQLKRQAITAQQKLNALQQEGAMLRLEEAARGPKELKQRQDAVKYAEAERNAIVAGNTDLQDRLAFEAQSLVKLQIRKDEDLKILENATKDLNLKKLTTLEYNNIVNAVKEGVLNTEKQIELDREALRIAQATRFEKEKAGLQSQIGVTGTGLQAGFIGSAGKAFEAEMLKSGNKQQAAQLGELTNQLTLAQSQFQAIESSILSIGDAFGTAMTSGVASLVAGTASAEQIFADFLSSVGQALMKAAAVMIAQYTAIGIARLFAGIGSAAAGASAPIPGSGNQMTPGAVVTPEGFSGQFNNLAANGAYFSGGVAAFANGGIVGSPTMFRFANGGTTQTGLMGEAGPEAIMPLSRGPGGKLGVNASGLREAMGGGPGMGGAPVFNMSFETTRFGDTDYVSRDQLEAAMAQTRKQASSDGAKRGMSMTLDRLQQSPQTRSRVGLR